MVENLVIYRRREHYKAIALILATENKSYKGIKVAEKLSDKTISLKDTKTKLKVEIKLKTLVGGEVRRNMVQCSNCKDVIESVFTNHSVRCSCGRCCIDGGTTTLKRDKCTGRYKELSKYYI